MRHPRPADRAIRNTPVPTKIAPAARVVASPDPHVGVADDGLGDILNLQPAEALTATCFWVMLMPPRR
jgi:hypothetical protein